MASNKTGISNWLFNCLRSYIQGSSYYSTMVGSWDCYAIGVSGNVIINSRNFTADSRHNGWTINQGGRVLKNGWTTLNSSNASALSPYTLSGNAGNKYKVDTTSGSVYAVLDTYALNGESVIFKIVNATNTLILSTSTNTETIDGNALPYTITPTIYDTYEVSSDGSNFYLIH